MWTLVTAVVVVVGVGSVRTGGPATADPCGPAAGGGCTVATLPDPLASPTTTSTTAPPPAPSTTTTAPPPAPAAAGVPAGEVAGGSSRLVALMNQARAAAGAGPLAARSDVTAIAAGHSSAMADREAIWHNDAYFTDSVRHALGAGVLGENVAMNPSVDDANARLMNDPGHRANILDPRFSVVGVSVVADGKGELFVTEDFVQVAGARRAALAEEARGGSDATIASPLTPAAGPGGGVPASPATGLGPDAAQAGLALARLGVDGVPAPWPVADRRPHGWPGTAGTAAALAMVVLGGALAGAVALGGRILP